jgi:vacuolar-type H+-ATPase subunit B/Vma2
MQEREERKCSDATLKGWSLLQAFDFDQLMKVEAENLFSHFSKLRKIACR